jgi:phosphoribosylanthranilate isomerase
MHIKASRVTNLTDARYFAAKEVDFLGFNLEEGTDGYLDPSHMKAMREWVAGPKIVGEFDRANANYVREAAAFFALDAVQVSASTIGSDWSALEGLEVVLAIDDPLHWRAHLAQHASNAAWALIDFSRANISLSNIYAEIDFWKTMCAQRALLLQGDFSAAEWLDLLNALPLAGISLLGGEEERVGVKSFDEIEEIFERLGRS